MFGKTIRRLRDSTVRDTVQTDGLDGLVPHAGILPEHVTRFRERHRLGSFSVQRPYPEAAFYVGQPDQLDIERIKFGLFHCSSPPPSKPGAAGTVST